MAIIYLVRHAEPASSWHEASDPGLSELGRTQAEAVAETLSGFGRLTARTSPRRRCRETAEPYAALLSTEVLVEPRVEEIPTPGLETEERQDWLRWVARRTYGELDAAINHWRAALLKALIGIQSDTLFFTHLIAINVAVGAAVGDDRTIHFHPAHTSLTRLSVENGELRLMDKGAEGKTRIA